MTLLTLFTTVATRLEEPTSNVLSCWRMLSSCGQHLGYSNAQTLRMFRKYSVATGRRYF